MEISLVRRQVREAMDRAKRAAADRRVRNDDAARDFETFLTATAAPLFHQVAGILRAENHMFTVFTPAGSVRLMSDRSGDDYIELVLDTEGAQPQVVGHSSRSWGRRTIESESPVGVGKAVRGLTEDDVLTYLVKALEPFVER